jgi:hypothetical protein
MSGEEELKIEELNIFNGNRPSAAELKELGIMKDPVAASLEKNIKTDALKKNLKGRSSITELQDQVSRSGFHVFVLWKKGCRSTNHLSPF